MEVSYMFDNGRSGWQSFFTPASIYRTFRSDHPMWMWLGAVLFQRFTSLQACYLFLLLLASEGTQYCNPEVPCGAWRYGLPHNILLWEWTIISCLQKNTGNLMASIRYAARVVSCQLRHTKRLQAQMIQNGSTMTSGQCDNVLCS